MPVDNPDRAAARDSVSLKAGKFEVSGTGWGVAVVAAAVAMFALGAIWYSATMGPAFQQGLQDAAKAAIQDGSR